MKNAEQFKKTLMLVGFILGALFPVVTITLDLGLRDLSLRPSNVAMLFATNKIQWVILFMPVGMAGIFNYLGKILLRREEKLAASLEKEKEQFNVLEDIIINLEQRDFKGAGLVDSTLDTETKRVIGLMNTFRTKYHIDRDQENQHQWMMKGLNELSAILTSKEKIDKLTERITHFLVKYAHCIQGSLFLYQEEGDEKFLELKSCYAYDRKKFIERRFTIGEGVIGQCYLEKSRILLSDVPSDYVKITSGLGESTPTNLVVLPLVYNDLVEGIIELAGFQKFQEHELEFLDKAAASIANILSSVKTNERTQALLEDSQSTAEQMRAQEEEMRQNLEELAATEEEMVRKEQEYIRKINELEATQVEMQRAAWESKHKIETLQSLLERRNTEFASESSEPTKNPFGNP
jgi:hypothetical protein